MKANGPKAFNQPKLSQGAYSRLGSGGIGISGGASSMSGGGSSAPKGGAAAAAPAAAPAGMPDVSALLQGAPKK